MKPKKKIVTFEIDRELYNKFSRICEEKGKFPDDLIAKLISKYTYREIFGGYRSILR